MKTKYKYIIVKQLKINFVLLWCRCCIRYHSGLTTLDSRRRRRLRRTDRKWRWTMPAGTMPGCRL